MFAAQVVRRYFHYSDIYLLLSMYVCACIYTVLYIYNAHACTIYIVCMHSYEHVCMCLCPILCHFGTLAVLRNWEKLA